MRIVSVDTVVWLSRSDNALKLWCIQYVCLNLFGGFFVAFLVMSAVQVLIFGVVGNEWLDF